MRFEGLRALVTGGASGLGLGVVRAVVDAGGTAVVVDVGQSRGSEIAEELGDRVRFVATDVTDASEVETAVEAARQAFGGLDLAVSCAGVSPAERVVSRSGALHSLDTFRRTVEVNLIGAFDVVRRCAGVMTANEPGPHGERGVIVNVSSIAAFEGQKGQAAYAASKGGIAAMTLPLARDLAEHGIRVVSVCPGIMDTGMLAGIDDDRRNALLDLPVFPKRLGTPADFAHLVRSICEAELINGETIRLDAATRL